METASTAPEFLPHLKGLADHEIRLPRCANCGRFHWYPMPACPHCQSDAVQWQAVAGDAKLYSWTVVRHAFQESLRDELPYTVALVTFDDAPGVRLVTNLVDAGAADLRCDMPLRPVFDAQEGPQAKVRFRPA